MFRSLIAVTLPLLVLFLTSVPQSLQAQVSQPSDVRINNFPELQQIKGSVSIEGTTKSIAKEGLVVPTSQRAELSEMIYAGTIETEGFTSLLISLQGEMRSDVFSSGTIGVVLIPDEKSILRILREAKRIQFPIECKVHTKSGDLIFVESEQVQQRIAFPRYKMYLYNTANKSVEANVYLYLSNSPTVSGRGIPAN